MSTVRPATVNFKLYPDATFGEKTTLRDSAGVAVDLSARTARMQVRRDRDAPAALFDLTTENGGIVLDDEGGITLSIPADATYPALNPPIDRDGEVWYHDILITAPDGTRDRLYQGVIIVQPGVTVPA